MNSEILQPSVLDRKINRRDVLKGAFGVAAGAIIADHSRPDSAAASAEAPMPHFSNIASRIEIAENPASAELVGAPNFSLPVRPDEREGRTEHIKFTQVFADKSMQINPPDLAVKDVSLNPNFSIWERKNRLDLVTANTLIRAHALSEQYIDGEDYSKLDSLLRSGEMPPEPNWAEYALRLSNKESLPFRIMGLPEGAPPLQENVQWLEADIRKGMDINFTAEPGVFHYQGYEGKPVDGYSLRVNDDKRMQLDIFYDNKGNQSLPDVQDLYDATFSLGLMRALTVASISLGVVNHEEGSGLFGKYVTRDSYADKINNGTLYPEQNEILLGQYADGHFPDALLHVELAGK